MAEKKFTLEQAQKELQEQLKVKEQDRIERINEFTKLVNGAGKKTNCALIVDVNSPLNNLQIIPVSKI